jgi:pimeloyl-ACP methyl ester carboxylesterase
VLVDGGVLIGVVFQMLYDKDMTLLLPKMIYDTSRGSYTTLSIMLGLQLSSVGQVSIGMHYAVQCSEEVPFISPDTIAVAVSEFPHLHPYFRGNLNTSSALFALCNQWGVHPPAPAENAPVTSDIPTLILAGAYDPITPPVWGQLASKTLSTSYFYVFPNRGHGISPTGGCATRIVSTFLENPTVAPEATCLQDEKPPRFIVLPFEAGASTPVPAPPGPS